MRTGSGSTNRLPLTVDRCFAAFCRGALDGLLSAGIYNLLVYSLIMICIVWSFVRVMEITGVVRLFLCRLVLILLGVLS